ncbi:unnamed protein product [Callosobruchus maculatus]|uniref:RING-type domain-containing protein n=1 Tax=Callosobruchus maculatus TaxID=64391 RepID=A0A653C2P0_CALMS|nr:unnamed protein product [Callosobruchus maculatus]
MTQFLTTIPQCVMENLKCSICQRYLSVSPVSGTKGKYTCGRCCPTAETSGPYEEIAKHILFPCSIEGCKTKLIWGQVLVHEAACTFRRIICPYMLCCIPVRLNEVLSHFIESHRGFAHDHRCRMSLAFNRTPHQIATHCFSYKKTCFLVFVKTITNCEFFTFKFGVAVLPNAELNEPINDMNYTVSLYLSTASGICVMKKVGKQISQYDETKHCMYCIIGRCHQAGHYGDKFWDVEFSNIDSSYYYGDIKCIVKVAKFTSLTERLECPVCKNYMHSKIFICPTGHSICKKCRKMIKTCPLCKCTMGTTRNYTLEDIAETLEVPCHNDYNGCQFVGQVAETIQHETICGFGEKTTATKSSTVQSKHDLEH